MTISESLEKLEALERALRDVLGCDEQRARLWAARIMAQMAELPAIQQAMLEFFSGEMARVPKQ